MNNKVNHANGETSSFPQFKNDRILRWPAVQERVSICRSHAHQLITQGKFPAQIKLGPRASGWLESEINAWIEQRITESRLSNPEAA